MIDARAAASMRVFVSSENTSVAQQRAFVAA
jgi:hypothetical protein